MSPISDRRNKINEIIRKIETGIGEINDRYRRGPDLYFYQKLIDLRREAGSLGAFIRDDHNLEIIYATLVSWDMNARAAKMKYFDGFRASILSCRHELEQLGKIKGVGFPEEEKFLRLLISIYEKLSLMESSGRLVSNSKALHFLMPDLLVPMDRKNTLEYFYGNTGESVGKYLDIMGLCLEIMRDPRAEGWDRLLDRKWNQTIPKMIDNAIILIKGVSVRE